MVYGQLESAWPVYGSVLVQADATADKPRDVAYVTAGRSSFLDGGIHVYGLDPRTGELLHHTCLDSPRPDPSKDTGTSCYMDGARSDILVSDGADLYLFQERLAGDLTRIPTPLQHGRGHRVYPPFPERGASGRHLITICGLLDDTYNEGTYWNYSGRDGAVEKELPLPAKDARDCVAFANFSGNAQPRDLVHKSRHKKVWVFDKNSAVM